MAGADARREPACRDSPDADREGGRRERRARLSAARRRQAGSAGSAAAPVHREGGGGPRGRHIGPSDRGSAGQRAGSQVTRPLLAPTDVTGTARPVRRFMSWGFGPATLRLFALGLVLIVPAWIDRRAVAAMFLWD